MATLMSSFAGPERVRASSHSCIALREAMILTDDVAPTLDFGRPSHEFVV